MTAALTDSRKRGLLVLLVAEFDGRGSLRISNQTHAAAVYWQVADWLIQNGLAERVGGEYIKLTAAGRDIGVAAGDRS